MRWIFGILTSLLLTVTLTQAQGNHCFNMGQDQVGCSNYNTAAYGEEFDNTANAKSMNVWHTMIHVPQHAGKIVSGIVDSSGDVQHWMVTTIGTTVYEYMDYWATSNANTFVAHPEMGSSVALLAVGPVLYSLQANSFCTQNYGAGFYGVYAWNGSAWTNPSSTSCVMTLKEASDGTLIAIEQGGLPIYSTNGGAHWTLSTYNGYPSLQVGDVTLQSATYGCIVLAPPPKGNYLLECGNPATGFTNGFTSFYALHASLTPHGVLWALNNQNVVERWQGTCFTNSCWDSFQGSGFTTIDSCGIACTFSIDETGNLYRFPDYYMQWTAQVTGNTTCNPSPCPTMVGNVRLLHTPGVTVKFNAKSIYGGQTTTGPAVSPETQVNISARDATYDPFTCFDLDDPASCVTTTTTGSVTCAVAGLFYNLGVTTTSASWIFAARSRTDLGQPIGQGSTCTLNRTFLCGTKPSCTFQGPFNYYCDQGVNPDPPADYFLGDSLFGTIHGYITVCATDGNNPPGPPANLWGFDISGPCYYPVPGASPLFCVKDPLPGGVGNGPYVAGPLYTTSVPKDTKGMCTIDGNTQ